jgi:thiol-disulfide isomerase/thioredoxin
VVIPADTQPVAGPGEPRDEIVAEDLGSERAGGGLATAGLVALAIAAVGAGFLLGRAVRHQTGPSGRGAGATGPVGGPYAPLGGDHPLIGQQAPDLPLTDLATGRAVSIAEYAGRPLLVNFWATWCPPCRAEMPWLQAVYDRHRGRDLVVLAVNAGERVPDADAPAQIEAFVAAMGLTFPVLHGAQADAVQYDWGVWGLPSSFLVDRHGLVVDAVTGMYPSQGILDAKVASLLDGS